MGPKITEIKLTKTELHTMTELTRMTPEGNIYRSGANHKWQKGVKKHYTNAILPQTTPALPMAQSIWCSPLPLGSCQSGAPGSHSCNQ